MFFTNTHKPWSAYNLSGESFLEVFLSERSKEHQIVSIIHGSHFDLHIFYQESHFWKFVKVGSLCGTNVVFIKIIEATLTTGLSVFSRVRPINDLRRNANKFHLILLCILFKPLQLFWYNQIVPFDFYRVRFLALFFAFQLIVYGRRHCVRQNWAQRRDDMGDDLAHLFISTFFSKQLRSSSTDHPGFLRYLLGSDQCLGPLAIHFLELCVCSFPCSTCWPSVDPLKI